MTTPQSNDTARPVLQVIVQQYVRSLLPLRLCAGTALLVLIGACGSDPAPTEVTRAVALALRDGNDQSGPAGGILNRPLSVGAVDAKQNPVPGTVVRFRVTRGAQVGTTLLDTIAVAGFGILAIFFMIVVEKTRDIGILKSLGASSGGVMSIFLSYGLALGVVGSGVGMVLGLLFVRYINIIEDGLTWLPGREVFPETNYYVPEIPTSVNPLTVAFVVMGAMGIAVLASILPARRAARLHPVEALRYQ